MHSRAYLLLKKDLAQSEKEPLKGIKACPVDEDNLFQWEASISGLSDTPWEGGVFRLSLVFDNSYNTRPPNLWFTTVPFHPNVHPDSGVPCCGLLHSWDERCSLQSLLLALQCLLSEPEMDDGCVLNPDAARLLYDSPHTYRQIALDCVVTSLRIDAGLPPFPGEEEDGTREPSPTYKGRLSALSSWERSSAKSTVKPKTISFDDYHALWKGIATSQPLRPKRNPMIGLLVKDPALTKVHLGAEPTEKHKELEKKINQHHMLKYGNFQPPNQKEPILMGSEFKDRRMAELRDMYKAAISIQQTEPPEKMTTVTPVLYSGNGDGGLSTQTDKRDGGLSIQTDNMEGGVPVLDIDDLVHWTHSLDKDTIENQ